MITGKWQNRLVAKWCDAQARDCSALSGRILSRYAKTGMKEAACVFAAMLDKHATQWRKTATKLRTK